MRRFGVQGLRLHRRVRTTVPDPAAAKAPDLIGRDFTAGAVNQRYVGDITYLPVGDRGFLYLATVLDLHSRRLAGWAIADHMRTDLVTDALRAAQQTRGSLHGAIMHTDHGAPVHLLDLHPSGPRRRARAVDGLDRRLLRQRHDGVVLGPHADRTPRSTAVAHPDRVGQRIFEYLEIFHNRQRRHSSLGMLSPIEYERVRPMSLSVA
ncbi:DDE-type integrase/transposase/recombinase [Micromonospora rubida]|uniref:DDE-type integrase/transposase/recombinase n=1 Tax=Micromonospora rubida TaxID=2697657 RepID=A0ABW7STA5_9ACTN